jgi:phosphodiesterase/alkaline phosphatase D-like protein
MLGHPTAESVRVWGRTSDSGEFSVRYGVTEGKLSQISKSVTTRIENDNTGYVTLDGLKSDQRYYYQIQVNGRPHGMPGSFLTLPSAEKTRNAKYNPEGLFNFRFQIGSCANQNPVHGNGHRAKTYETLNRDWADKTHFHIMNGDWLYEELREYPAEAWRLRSGIDKIPPVVEHMPTVVGVWENYKLYLSRGISLSQWHRNVPSYFTFDDHELVNDIWGAATAGRRDRRAVFRDI